MQRATNCNRRMLGGAALLASLVLCGCAAVDAAARFSKISNAGAALPANAALGSAPGDWACTHDALTGLTWEVKQAGERQLRYRDHLYTWFAADSGDGNAGVESGGVCAGGSGCDTARYVADVNAAALCGQRDWRLPTLRKLQTLVDAGRRMPAIDVTWFANTPPALFWSADAYAPDAHDAWGVLFDHGRAFFTSKGDMGRIRVVRSTPK